MGLKQLKRLAGINENDELTRYGDTDLLYTIKKNNDLDLSEPFIPERLDDYVKLALNEIKTVRSTGDQYDYYRSVADVIHKYRLIDKRILKGILKNLGARDLLYGYPYDIISVYKQVYGPEGLSHSEIYSESTRRALLKYELLLIESEDTIATTHYTGNERGNRDDFKVFSELSFKELIDRLESGEYQDKDVVCYEPKLVGIMVGDELLLIHGETKKFETMNSPSFWTNLGNGKYKDSYRLARSLKAQFTNEDPWAFFNRG